MTELERGARALGELPLSYDGALNAASAVIDAIFADPSEELVEAAAKKAFENFHNGYRWELASTKAYWRENARAALIAAGRHIVEEGGQK